VPSAPVLCLLGDIAVPVCPRSDRGKKDRFAEFLYRMSKMFEYVLVLSGNHEYYQGTKGNMMEVDEAILEICKSRNNLFYLNCSSIRINDVRILGCTLWSFVPPEAETQVENFLNDYRLIHISKQSYASMFDCSEVGDFEDCDKGSALTAAVSTKLHLRQRAWLDAQIKRAKECQEVIFVATHHTPSFCGTSSPQYGKPDVMCNPAGFGFSTSLHQMFDGVHTWAYGHTHFNNDQLFGATRLVCNQRGYHMSVDKHYRNDFVLDFQKPVVASKSSESGKPKVDTSESFV